MDIKKLEIVEGMIEAVTKPLAGAQYIDALEKFAPQGSLYTERTLQKFISVTPESKTLLDNVRLVANYNCNVLILGEQGTGKELIATALKGSRRGNLVAVNCAEITDTLGLSQLFGHEKGAFTGATEAKQGLIRHATDGVLFLDEVADLSAQAQTSLLRLTEYRVFRPVGALIEQTTNCRFIAATNKDLSDKELFRSDLYSRLGCIILKTQPFRSLTKEQRLEFFQALAPDVKLTDELIRPLTEHAWPGNIRQLKNFITRLRIFGLEKALQLDFH